MCNLDEHKDNQPNKAVKRKLLPKIPAVILQKP